MAESAQNDTAAQPDLHIVKPDKGSTQEANTTPAAGLTPYAASGYG